MPGGPSLRPLPRPSPSDLPRSRGPGSAASACRPPPSPARAYPAAGPQLPGAAPLPPAGGFQAVPRPVPPGSSRQPTSREGGERRRRERSGGREAGERRGAARSPDLPEPARSARTRRLSGSPPPRTSLPLLPGVRLPPPSSSCYARRRRPPPQPSSADIPNSADSLLGRASSPRPFFLPPPRARLPAPGLLAGRDCLRPLRGCAGVAQRLLALPESPAAAALTPARGVRGRRSGRARPRPAPALPSPARRGDREDEQRRKAEKENTPERGQPSGGRGTSGPVGGDDLGTAAVGSAQSAGGWPAGRGPGRRAALGKAPRVWESSWRETQPPRLRPRDEGHRRVCFWWVHARLVCLKYCVT